MFVCLDVFPHPCFGESLNGARVRDHEIQPVMLGVGELLLREIH